MIGALALGGADTALRVTLDFVVNREIFGGNVIDIPYTRRQLAECFADLLLTEAVSTGAVRGLQACPGQAAVQSAIAKYYVPTTLERTLAELSTVLGARLYLRGHPHYGIFQKVMRDLLVSVFGDGNTVVNLKSVGAQLSTILDRWSAADDAARERAQETITAAFDIDAKLAEWVPAELQLFARDGDATVLTLPDTIAAIRDMAAQAHDPRQQRWLERAADLADRLVEQVDILARERREWAAASGRGYGSSAQLYRFAERYCSIHAAAALLRLVVDSRSSLRDPLPDGAVIMICLERVWRSMFPNDMITDAETVDRAVDVLLELHQGGKLFSHWQFRVHTSGEGTRR